ncbi:MAG: SIS domain-containing protein [Clostridiales bacterium]|nr:SIS domain-containing protein [Clostridiales bacterium]
MSKSKQYFSNAIDLLKKVSDTQSESIRQAVDAVSDTLKRDGMIFAFGTGHSHMLAEELFYRAGGLVKVYPIFDESLMLHANATRSSQVECLPGYAATLVENGPEMKAGDVIFIFSNSGRNAVPIEMAMQAKSRGLCVICITNLAHSSSVTSRHSSGKKLYELCDIVIDNCGVIGDTSVKIGGLTCGPTSTVAGAAILQAIVCGVVERLQEDGAVPEVFISGNVDGGHEKNQVYYEKYRKLIRML